MPKKSTPIQVVTWNVHRRGADVLDALEGLVEPDVLTLQEVTFEQRSDFKKRLGVMGLKCSPDSHRRAGGKDYGNLIAIASRLTFDPNKPRYPRENLPLPEALVQALVSISGRSFLVISVHIPNGSGYGWKKIDTFEVLNNVVREAKRKSWVVAGDFNEPRYTLQDGEIVTWGQEQEARGRFVCWKPWEDGSGRCHPGKKWDGAVRWLFDEHDGHRLRHAYWQVHGHGALAVSHVTQGQARWFDHIFVSRDFRVEKC
jgi:endonuclease/exonuclease/phosphatase family metal-dependent hydrolase